MTPRKAKIAPRATKQVSSLAAALGYYDRGWKPVVIPYKLKHPIDRDWQLGKPTRDEVETAFSHSPLNIGVQLGAVSNGLCDVDLDCPEALALARHFLPETGAIFGRHSKPRAHWLYRSDLCD